MDNWLPIVLHTWAHRIHLPDAAAPSSRKGPFVQVLLLTADRDPDHVLPALVLLPITLRAAAPEPAALLDHPTDDWLVVVDARQNLPAARTLCQILGPAGLGVAILAVITVGAAAAIGPDWRVSDIVLDTAPPAEVHTRLRLLAHRSNNAAASGVITWGDLSIDVDTYTAHIRGQPLDLTYKEFELLKFLAQHPSRVFSREYLVTQVWGYDFYGGTRTVDVHIRRLRAKLGPDHQSLIGTLRNVGYKLDPPTQ